MKFFRASGILLHPTSLPGRFAIGDLGAQASRFADFLAASGQSFWQVLPLAPAGDGGSPYSAYSAFAGNTLLISPEKLLEDGLLGQGDLEEIPQLTSDRVDFKQATEIKEVLLDKAFTNFQKSQNPELRLSFAEFAERNSLWLEDYALFRALKKLHGQAAWFDWERPLVLRDAEVLARARADLRTEIEAQKFSQFLFFKQWSSLKRYCNQHGIRIIGDIPMFVAHDSADVWANPDQFKLDQDHNPIVVAGVPPDYFSATGQFWGNPIYNWVRMRQDGFKWWTARVRATFETVDIARIDHFRGFAACWEIPRGETTAENGQWVEAPGRELFQRVRTELGDLPIIAEDLGEITPDVDELRNELGFPGMRVLQFAFSGDQANINLPDNYEPNTFAYTGTHDNDTAVGWFRNFTNQDPTRTPEAMAAEKKFCLNYLNSDGREINWDFIRAVYASAADGAIVPLQDVLGLGSEARMNIPNRAEGNWAWRFKDGDLRDAVSARLRALTQSSRRAEDLD